MAIADTITSMQNHTSNAYTMIGYGTDLTGINKNLENLSSTIFEAFLEALRNPDTLFNNLPKTSASGSNITLNGTAYAPMRITLNPTALSQDGTPTPSSPQDIHTISGDNSVVVEGKNLLPFTNQDFTLKNVRYYVQNGSIILNGTSTGETSSVSADFKNNFSFWLDAGTYTFSIKSGRETRLPTYILKYSDNSSLGAINGYNSSSATFTLNEKTQVYLGFYVYQQTFTNDSPELQLEKGTATTYTPYVSQTNPINLGEYELGTIGNYSNEFVRSGGENIFNPSDLVQGYLSNTLIDNRTTTARTDAILLKAGTYYYKFKYASEIWVKMVTYTNTTDTSGTYVFNSKSSNYTTTFTLDNDTYVRFGFDETLSNITASATIMLSTTNIDYVPYEKGWYYKQGIGKVVLDGTEYWGLGTTNVFYTTAITDYAPSNNIPKSNYFTGVSNVSGATDMASKSDNSIGFINSTSTIRFYIKSTNFATESAVKTWLENNNTTCYYVLATPTYTKITGELAQELEQVYKGMLSYDGTTNISQVNNDLGFVINASGILGE